MFRNNFVVSLKSGEKFFRENGDKIEVPFDSEYSIFMKNINSRKAVVKVSIDGKDVLDGHSLVVQPNSALELEGFMDGNFSKNKFKFIKMTEKIENFRGKYPEDSLLVVEYDFEKERPLTKEIVYIPHYPPYPQYPYSYYYPGWMYMPNWTYTPTITYGGRTTSSITIKGNNDDITYTNCNYSSFVPSENDGITVKGNDISNQFYPTYIGEMENHPTVISLKMIGISKEISKEKVVFTSDKKICLTCGENNRYSNKFCSCCGTRLI